MQEDNSERGHYQLLKIALMKNPNNYYVNNGILFGTLCKDLNLDANTRLKKKIIRDNIRKMFEYWKQVGLLSWYEFEKKGQAFYKISFGLTFGLNTKE